ncbi:Xaa-Pro dipeptidase [Oleiagrimonas sp. C23AA]|uniref:Xaa-Pro dipeptidase n=1 Tax=Oleiagrimonas sp. C23AA TaxID=2719047 RepID=UPI001422403A|nr:Xaa-Pro dipeptidase [Oleiagrimonas sp. C23AA]NII09785.1 Xaa-Pro dipeptidase [Oleiagrimonas sp. C23AA]
MNDELATLYPQHLQALRQRTDAALDAAGLEALVVPAGQPALKFLDDMHYPFAVHPHFKHWLPLIDAPGSWLVYAPGKKPKLVFLQPRDYWHVVPEAPSGYWVDQFDIVTIREADEARAHLPKDPARCAVIGEAHDAVGDMVPNNPKAVLDYLHYHRVYKTPYELVLMRQANRIGARAHRAAETAFRVGESELGIHMAYLQAAGQIDAELPYNSIVGLNEHGAVLHYMHFDRTPPAESLTFLIDAGASCSGYASDITRSYATEAAAEFQPLIDGVNRLQRELCDMVRPGQDYRELHVKAHHMIGQLLAEHDFISMSAEAAVEQGVTRTFFPHGLGHSIGLQVHDVGGFMASAKGDTVPQPKEHPFLRQTRGLEAGMVCTIEPGLYFIDMLLGELKETPAAKQVNWDKVARFGKYGGIRIEDDVVCTDGDPENLTRDAFAALG